MHLLFVFMMHDDIEFHRTVTIVELIKVLFTLAYQCIENLTFLNFFLRSKYPSIGPFLCLCREKMLVFVKLLQLDSET